MTIQNYVKDVLESSGYKLIEENFKYKNGEIDLIMKHGEFIVFVEVKSRWNINVFEALSNLKRKRLKLSIDHWLNLKNMQNLIWRVDFVGVEISKYGFKLEHEQFIDLER